MFVFASYVLDSPANCRLDLPDGEHVEVALSEGKALVFCARQPEAKCQNWECEGEEAGDDKKQRPQRETAREQQKKEDGASGDF